MTTVNTIKTRILNKYDSLDNYKNFKPLKGEICIVEVATVQQPTTVAPGFDGDTYDERPIVGIKVGDGVHTFAELPWVQAAAGDVSSFIKGIVDETEFNKLVNTLIANANLASADSLTAIDTRLTATESAIGSTEINGTLTEAIADLQSAIGSSSEGLGAQVEALKGNVSDLQTAISDTGALGSRVVTLESEMDAVQAATNGYSASKTIASDIQGVKNTADGAQDAATAAQNKADKNKETLEVLVGTNNNDTNKSIRDIATLVISEALTEGGEKFDTLQEIAAWIKDHPKDVTAINEAIQSVKKNLDYGENEDGSEKVPDTVNTRIANALSQYVTDDELGSAIARIETLETAIGEEGSVADRIDSAKEELIGTSNDTSSDNTIYGAKKYAEEKANAAQAAAEIAAADDATAKADKALKDATTLIGNEKTRAEEKEGELNDAITAVNTRIDNLDSGDTEDGVVATVIQTDGKISVTHKKVGVADLADEVFVFYCGNAAGYAEDMKTVEI